MQKTLRSFCGPAALGVSWILVNLATVGSNERPAPWEAGVLFLLLGYLIGCLDQYRINQ